MAFIGNREKNFLRYLNNRFGLVLPKGTCIFYARGVRIGNPELMKSTLHGELGYAACDFGFNPTPAIMQNFGHLADKNVIELDAEQARMFASGKDLKIDFNGSDGFVIMRFQNHTVGLGFHEKKRGWVKNRTPEKRKRSIVNTIGPKKRKEG